MIANGILLPPSEKQILKPKFDWWPTLSIKLGYAHFWLGRQRTDGRMVYGLIEAKEDFTIGFTLYFISDETPMFSLLLCPAFFCTMFWCYPGERL